MSLAYDPQLRKHTGPYGTAVRIELPDKPEAAQTTDYWLITAPAYHPLWNQYVLGCVRLDHVPGFPAPYIAFPGATHEIHVVALDPSAGIRKPSNILDGPLPFLLPINIAHQFEATNDEMREACWFAAWGVTAGHLNPETADAPKLIREQWLGSLTKTLAHMRGEAHARPDGHIS